MVGRGPSERDSFHARTFPWLSPCETSGLSHTGMEHSVGESAEELEVVSALRYDVEYAELAVVRQLSALCN